MTGKRRARAAPRGARRQSSGTPRSRDSRPSAAARSVARGVPIVGIGASAGGLEAVSELLRHLPADTGLAFVLIQHLDPAHKSQLPEILAQTATMPVVTATHRLPVQPDHVYVMPPNVVMALDGDRLMLTDRPKQDRHLPIDRFFQSLAGARQNRAMGVVLSGTGEDGTLGLLAIKDEGGVTFVQDERSAKHAGMPHSAIAAGGADRVLAPARIADEIVRVARHSSLRSGRPTGTAPAGEADDAAVGEVLRAVQSATGVDFTGYKPATIRRRIARRMLLQRVDDMTAYARHLQRTPPEAQALHDDLLIHVTRFFRDPAGIDSLTRHVFPLVVRGRRPDEAIRMWVPGCASGEEAYSLVIALLEFLDEQRLRFPIQVFATDIRASAIDRARAARYPTAITADVSPGRLRSFFVQADGAYQLSKRVREVCVFAQHDLTRDPPIAGLDLISCCNVLIYLGQFQQDRALKTFHYALKPGAFLKLGPSEGVGRLTNLFEPVDKKHKVFTRRLGPTVPLGLGRPTSRLAAGKPPLSATHRFRTRGEIEREADRIVIGRHAPPGVVVGADMAIIQVRGRTGPFLEATPGSASLSLFRMLREGLAAPLRRALQRVAREWRPVRTGRVRFNANGKRHTVDLEVFPLGDPAHRHYLILFGGRERPGDAGEGAAATDRASEPAVRGGGRLVTRLARELAETRRQLQALTDEHESANEELRAAVEEAQSANEELQSTNEELETAKEELQATNEELTTLNDELSNRNQALSQLGGDLTNLLHSVEVPILMVGSDHRVRRVTPAAEQVLRVAPSDVGRALTDLRLSIDVSDLEALIGAATTTLVPQEKDVQARDGRWYSLRVRPYRTAEDRIDGAVVSFVDIDALRRGLEQVKEARDEAQAIVETVREPLVVLDDQLRVVIANRSFYTTFQVASGQTEGRTIFELGNRQWDIPALRRLLEEMLPEGRVMEDFEVEHRFEAIGLRTMKLNARRMGPVGHRAGQILLAIEDVTEARRLDATREQLRHEQIVRAEAEAATRAKDRFLAVLSHELRTPLNAMLSWTRILRNNPDPATAARGLDVIDRNVRAQVRLIEDLLDVSRIIAGRLRIDAKPVMVAPVVKAVVAAMRPAAEAKRVALEVALDEDAGPVLGDPVRLQQVVQNLVDNAVKFTPGDGRVEIAVARRDARVEIRVRDTGEGIPADRMADIWAGHRMLPDTATGRSGLGIGLTIVRNLLDLHGGDVRADSEGLGQGATFTVTLPLTDRPRAEVVATETPASEVSPAAEVERLDGVRVLVVDDEADTREVVGAILTRCGADVEVAATAATALRALDRARFDVLVSDLAMPEGDGYDLIRAVRQRAPERGGRVPALAVSAYARGEDRTQAIAAGYEQFLSKPVEPAQLLLAVATLAGVRPSPPASPAENRAARPDRGRPRVEPSGPAPGEDG